MLSLARLRGAVYKSVDDYFADLNISSRTDKKPVVTAGVKLNETKGGKNHELKQKDQQL